MAPVELRSEADDRAREANEIRGVWILVLFDMSFFALLFLAFVHARASNVGVFDRAQAELTVGLGLSNVAVLLTSSWFVALAVQHARAGRDAAAARMLGGAMLCGALFVAVKTAEYALKFSSGTDLHNDYFTYYFVLTGLHALHVLGGLVVLGVMRAKAARGGYRERVSGLENGATYWHMVDLLWVMIFPLLYLAR